MTHEYTLEHYDSFEDLKEIKARARKNQIVYPNPKWKQEWRKYNGN